MKHRVNGAVKRNNDFTESASMRGAPHADQGQTIRCFVLFFFSGLVKLVAKIFGSSKIIKINI